jgi:hypothetical protein
LRGGFPPRATGAVDGGLEPTFAYAGSLDPRPPLAFFDVRDEVCLRVGGFKHGEVLTDSAGRELIVVGVRRCPEGKPLLWFQPSDLGRQGAGAFPGARPEVLQERLWPAGGEATLEEADPWDFEEVEESDGETTIMCSRCRLPLGECTYADEAAGSLHGECMAQLMLDKVGEEEQARLSADAELKEQRRQEYKLGWRAAEMIPRNLSESAERLGCRVPLSRGMCCLVLREDPRSVFVEETFEAASAVNLDYLSKALRVRALEGTEPYFSLDPLPPKQQQGGGRQDLKHRMQVKRFQPSWLANTSVGEVLFQADYYLKELSMGEQQQPVVGMHSCFDMIDSLDNLALSGTGPVEGGKSAVVGGWSAREWFVIKQAKLLISEDGALVPQVQLGVEARELQHGPKGMEDKLVTRPDHPAVRYAEQFTHHFDLIAERKSVIFQLRELARASVLAKFLVEDDDIRKRMGDSWFYLGADGEKQVPSPGSLEVPQIWNERSSSRILVEENGEIVCAEEGIERTRHGIYGGVSMQMGLSDLQVVQTGGPRGPVITIPQRVTCSLPPKVDRATRLSSRPAQAKGVDLRLDHFDCSQPAPMEPQEEPGNTGSWAGRGRDNATGKTFWDSLGGAQLRPEDRDLLKDVFNPYVSDRRSEADAFVPPDGSATYVRILRRLVEEERRTREERVARFLREDFSTAEPGPFFPIAWAPAAGEAAVSAGATKPFLRRHTGKVNVTLQDLQRAESLFDKCAEDGTRFRIYRHGSLEVRTTQEHGGREVIGAVLSRGLQELDEDDCIVKVTEYVEKGIQDAQEEEEALPPYVSYVVFETKAGHSIVTQLHPDGSVAWEEDPDGAAARHARARAVRTAAPPKGAAASVRDLRSYVARAAEEATCTAGLSSPTRGKRYAQATFTRAAAGRWPARAEAPPSAFWRLSEGLWQMSTGSPGRLPADGSPAAALTVTAVLPGLRLPGRRISAETRPGEQRPKTRLHIDGSLAVVGAPPAPTEWANRGIGGHRQQLMMPVRHG